MGHDVVRPQNSNRDTTSEVLQCLRYNVLGLSQYSVLKSTFSPLPLWKSWYSCVCIKWNFIN